MMNKLCTDTKGALYSDWLVVSTFIDQLVGYLAFTFTFTRLKSSSMMDTFLQNLSSYMLPDGFLALTRLYYLASFQDF